MAIVRVTAFVSKQKVNGPVMAVCRADLVRLWRHPYVNLGHQRWEYRTIAEQVSYRAHIG